MPDVPAQGCVLRAKVPDGIFTLAIEADERTAATEHAAFADRCQPLLLRAVGGDAEEAVWLRAELISQLGALRQAVKANGLGYLGALAGEHDGRPALLLLGIAATPLEFPNGIDPASLLAAMLRGQYPGAAVEEFATAHGAGVGIRRCEETGLPAPADRPVTIAAGISQALVPFPEAGLLGTVTGFCYSPADIDVATVFTATIAHHLIVVPDGLVTVLLGWHGNGDEVAVSDVQQAATRTRRLADGTARESHADQVTLRECGRGGQAAAPCPLGVDLPAAEPEAYAVGVSGEDQGPAGIAAERDQTAQFGGRVAVAQQLRVINEHDAAPVEQGQCFGKLLFAQLCTVEQPEYPGRGRDRAERGWPRCDQDDWRPGREE